MHNHFPAGVFYLGISLFCIIGFVVSSELFANYELIIRIVLQVCFLFISVFIISYFKISNSIKTNGLYVNTANVISISFGILISYLILISESIMPHVLPILFVIGIFYSLYIGFSLSRESTKSFVKSIIIIYSICSLYFFISTQIFTFGISSIDKIENILPAINNIRLFIFVTSSILILLYGLKKASKEQRPSFKKIPIQYYKKPKKSLVFIGGLVEGFQKFMIRVWNIFAIILNRFFFIIGCAIFYVYKAVINILKEIITIFRESKDLISAGIIVVSIFFIAKYAVNLGLYEYDYLVFLDQIYIIESVNNYANLSSIFNNFLKLASLSLVIILLPLIYDNFIQGLFNKSFKIKIIKDNNLIINNAFASSVEAILLIGLFFTITGVILTLLSRIFNLLDMGILSGFRYWGRYTILSLQIILGLIIFYVIISFVLKKRNN